MTVHCPHCTTGYVLPAHLIGPAGARVRCPRCRASFHVAAPGTPPVNAGGIPSVAAVETPPAWAAPAAAPRDEPSRRGAPSAEPETDGGAVAVAEEPETPALTDPDALARAVVERWLERDGEAVVRARAARRLFRDHGPALFAAFDEWRALAGPDAPAAAFRAALHLRLGLSL